MKKILLLILVSLSVIGYSITRTSISDGSWINPLTWSPIGLPSPTDKIYINNVVTLDISFQSSDTIFVKNVLSLSNNCILSFSSVGTLIIVGDASNNGRIGTIGNGANIVGNFTFQKWVDHCDNKYSTFSTPFDVTLNSYNFLYTGFPGGYYYPSYNYINTYLFKEPIVNGYVAPSSTSQTILRGSGFFYWYSSQTIGTGSPSTTITYWDFPRQVSLKGSLDFTSTYNFLITNTPSSGNNGFNLVGNPYPGTIDWATNGNGNGNPWQSSNMNNSIYVWNSCSSVYSSYNGSVGVNGGSRYISPLQAFFVQANNSSASLSCNRKVLVDQSSTLLRVSSTTSDKLINNVLRISLGGDEIAIRLDSTSSLDNDSLTDSELYIGDSTRLYSYIYTLNKDYSINAVKDTDQIVPIKTKRGGVLSFEGINTFDKYSMTLKDLSNDMSYPIYNGLQYTFTDTSLVTYNTRFEIKFTKNIGNIKQYKLSSSYIYYDENSIYINKLKTNTNIIMFDLLGREVYNIYDNNDRVVIKRPEYPVIIYLIDGDYIKTKKIL